MSERLTAEQIAEGARLVEAMVGADASVVPISDDIPGCDQLRAATVRLGHFKPVYDCWDMAFLDAGDRDDPPDELDAEVDAAVMANAHAISWLFNHAPILVAAAERCAALEAKCDRLRDRLRLVIEAAENYRACQGTLGDRHPETGRAWVAMRRGIEDARKTLAEGDPR